MKFGPVPVAESPGAVLAHSMDVRNVRWRKGRVLSEADAASLAAAGIAEVIVARLGAEDINEDAAAAEVAAALASDPAVSLLRLTSASAGRVNLYAMSPGALDINAEAIKAANQVDPMITVATLPAFARIREGGMAATVKIISYGVARGTVSQAANLARDAMRVRPVAVSRACLIQTDIGAGPGKGEAAMRGRLDALGIDLADVETVPHRVEELAEAIRASDSDLVLILTASATQDLRDVAPSAVRASGGSITRFGMPVDPGNLLFLGTQGGRPVIGLPGCARSPALNGADWVLERVVCGMDVNDAHIAAMGVGGLLKESPVRPHPRERR